MLLVGEVLSKQVGRAVESGSYSKCIGDCCARVGW